MTDGLPEKLGRLLLCMEPRCTDWLRTCSWEEGWPWNCDEQGCTEMEETCTEGLSLRLHYYWG